MILPELTWRASPNISARTAKIDQVIVHDCQASAASAVSWFSQERSRVSAHLVLAEAGTQVVQMVAFHDKAWHAMIANSRSIGLEMGGLAERGFPQVEWQAAANIVAYLCHRFGIPPVWCKGGHAPGFTSHYDLGKPGGGHSDPTTDPKVWAAFVARVEAASKAGGYPTVPWGHDTAPVTHPAAVA